MAEIIGKSLATYFVIPTISALELRLFFVKIKTVNSPVYYRYDQLLLIRGYLLHGPVCGGGGVGDHLVAVIGVRVVRGHVLAWVWAVGVAVPLRGDHWALQVWGVILWKC